MPYPCNDDPQEVIESIVEAEVNAARLDTFVNGAADETVILDNGRTPTLRNLVSQIKAKTLDFEQILEESVTDIEGMDLSARTAIAEGTSTPRTFASRLADIINVKDFGAKGDGTTNDTAAWNAFHAADGGMKYIPAGDYLVNGEHKIVAHGIWADTSSSDAYNELKIYAPQQWYASAAESLVDDGYYDNDTPYAIAGECNVLVQGDTVVMIDSGGSNRSKMTKAFLQAIGVTHVDYLIFSHYHYDHVTYFSGFSQNGKSSLSTLAEDVDLSRCKFYLPQPRSAVDSRATEEGERYQLVMNKLAALGKTANVDYFFPSDLEILQITDSFKITFMNAGVSALQEVLAIDQEQRPNADVMKINDCSMGCLVEHGNSRIFFSGDMEKAAEQRIADQFVLLSTFDPNPRNDNASVDESPDISGNDYDDEGNAVTDTYIEDYAQPLHASTETAYEKLQDLDLFKLNHHGVNHVGYDTAWQFYKFVHPRFAYSVSQYGYLSGGDSAGMDRRNETAFFHDATIYNSYYELTEFVSRGNGVENVRGQREGFNRNGWGVRTGDVISPYNGINSGGGGRWWAFIGIDLSSSYRQASFLVYVSTTRIEGYSSGVFEFSINGYEREAGQDCFDPVHTRIRTIYSTQTGSEFRNSFGIAYFGTDPSGISHYAICAYKSNKHNHIKATILGANYINNGVDCYQMSNTAYWRYKDADGEYQLYTSARGDKTAEQHESSRATLHFYNEYTCTMGAYDSYLPWYGNSNTVADFDGCSVPGRYHVRWTSETANAPISDGSIDGELIVERLSAAASVSVATRATQTLIVHGPLTHCGRIFYRGNTAGGESWSGWREIISSAPAVNNAQSLGTSSLKWSEVYAATGTIQTSDERQKSNIDSPSDALMRAWGRIGFKVFQMRDAVAKKGADARLHVGVIAQEVQAAFASEGLDASRYGLFCHDEWDAVKETVDVVDVEAVVDGMGNILSPAVAHREERVVRPAGDAYSIRYDEALALECAYQRWRLEQIEARLNEISTTTSQDTGE